MASNAASTTTTATITDITSIGELKAQNHSIQLLHSNVNNNNNNNGIPHGLGLLTTVASLPPKYRSRYLSINTKCETPLDLSVKSISPQIANDVPIAASFTEVYTEPSNDVETLRHPNENNNDNGSEIVHQVAESKPATVAVTLNTKIELYNRPQKTTIFDLKKSPKSPSPTPTKRKFSEQSMKEEQIEGNCIKTESIVEQFITNAYTNPLKMAKTNEHMTTKRDSTPTRPIKSTDTAPKTIKPQQPAIKPTKNKATRKLKFDEETSSPVSGTIIRPLEDITDGSVQYSNGDIDPKYNIVEITEETKAELAAIKNVIGDYICKLCRLKFDDAFGLAQHRCACIVLLEYRCPECGKQFNCPANLASHRRWHKPKKDALGSAVSVAKKENRNNGNSILPQTVIAGTTAQQRRIEMPTGGVTFSCDECGKGFKRQAYLRKHQLTHNNNNNNNSTNTKTNGGKKSHTEIESKSISMTSGRVAVIDAASSTRITERSNSIRDVYQPFRDGSSSGASISSPSSSSQHSYSGVSTTNEDEIGVTYMVNGNSININSHSNNIAYDYDNDSMSDCSNSSTGYGRLQIVESGLTEEENIAAAALTNLRNCASVIQHTTLAH